MNAKHSIVNLFLGLRIVDRAIQNSVMLVIFFCLSGASSIAQQQLPPLVPLSQGSGRGQNSGAATSGLLNIGAVTNAPISAGETVHVLVYDAPDLSVTAQVSREGDIAVPMVGAVHLEGLNSVKAEHLIESRLKDLRLLLNPHITVTVDPLDMGVSVLGEVHNPGVYQTNGKHLLSDVLAMAGGLTANAGRQIGISNADAPEREIELPWDPTMHNTNNYNREVHPGDRVLVRPCGIAYVGGNVGKPGAYSLCGSPVITLSEIIAMAGGTNRFTNASHTYIIRTQQDGTRAATEVNIFRIQKAKDPDPPIREDDIVYVSTSTLKAVLSQAEGWALTVSTPLIYTLR